MHEASNTKTPIRLAPAVFWASIAGAVIIGWAAGLAPEYLGGFGHFILYSMLLLCLGTLIGGIVVSINEPSESKSYVLSPEELGRWRSIKPGMERHEVTAILGQPDGPPVKPSLILARPVARTPSFEDEGLVVYTWGRGKVRFRPNGGPVVEVIIPEYI